MSFVTVAVIGAGASLAGGAMGASAAGSAARTQAEATQYAADLTRQTEQEALQLQRESMYNVRSDQLPWLQTGAGAVYQLGNLMGVPTPAAQQVMPTQQMPYVSSGEQSAYQNQQKLAEINAQIEKLNNDWGASNYSKWETMGSGSVFGKSAMTNPEYIKAKSQYQSALQALESQKSNLSSTTANAQTSSVQTPSGMTIDPNTGMMYSTGTEKTGLTGPERQTTTDATPSPITSGTTGELAQPMSEVMQNWQQDPGYAFRQEQGEKAVNRFLADRGMPFGGTAAKAMMDFNQNLASAEYSNVWNRTSADRNDRFNRLAALAGLGQTSAQSVGNSATNSANNSSNIMMNSAAVQGDLATQAANARASGTIGSANAWSGALGNIAALPGQYYMMSQLLKK